MPLVSTGFLLGFPSEVETVLVMLSGGIDSTYLLYHYLRDSEHPVHAHHVSIRYPHLQRWRAEDPATEKIVAWCRENLREFEYSSSRFDLDVECVGWDSDLLLLVASKIGPNLGSPMRVALGWCMEDVERAPVRDRVERGVTNDVWKALRESAGAPQMHHRIHTPLVDQEMTKEHIVSRLPTELLALTWSCRTPVFDDSRVSPCGRCHACATRDRVLSG